MGMKTGIHKAVDQFDGSPSKFAEVIGNGVLRQHVEHWLKVGRVPAHHCLAIEQVTSGAVTRRDLRPDDWHLIWPDVAEDHQCASAAEASHG